MSQDGYEFSKEELEELVVVAAIRNKAILPKIVQLPEDIFKDEYYQWIFGKVKSFYNKYRTPIKRDILLSELEDEVDESKWKMFKKIIKELYTVEFDVEDIDFSINAFKTLVNRRSILSKIDEIIAKLKANDINSAIEIFRSPLTDISIDVKEHSNIEFSEESFNSRNERRLNENSKFLKKLKYELFDSKNNFDELAKNTFVKGRNVVWLSPPKGGKTTTGIYTTLQAARQGLNVLHIDRENGGNLIEDRIDASLLGIPIDRIEDGSYLKMLGIKEINERRRKLEKLNKKIKLVYMPDNTIWDEYAFLDELRFNENWIPDVIVDDYPAMLKGPKKNSFNKTEYIEERYKEVDKLCRGNKELNRPEYLLVSFIHTNIDAIDSEELTPKDISWAKNICHKVDGLLGLTRNSDEKREDMAKVQFIIGRHWGKSDGINISINFNGELCRMSPSNY